MNDDKKSTTLTNENSRRSFLKGFTTMVGGVVVGSMLTGNAISVAMAYVPRKDSSLTDGSTNPVENSGNGSV